MSKNPIVEIVEDVTNKLEKSGPDPIVFVAVVALCIIGGLWMSPLFVIALGLGALLLYCALRIMQQKQERLPKESAINQYLVELQRTKQSFKNVDRQQSGALPSEVDPRGAYGGEDI